MNKNEMAPMGIAPDIRKGAELASLAHYEQTIEHEGKENFNEELELFDEISSEFSSEDGFTLKDLHDTFDVDEEAFENLVAFNALEYDEENKKYSINPNFNPDTLIPGKIFREAA